MEVMKHFFLNYFLLIMAVFFLSSCSDLSKEAEKRLNELENKTESLDSLINKEVDKVLALDSLITIESDKVKKLDSLINISSSKLDSIAKDKVKILEKIIN
ncbi:MAG: hypothetical protein IH598_09285 [Bacteroidales bacterium]|nr:hypothetical protein [Bacteroidales bacterium]